MPIIPNDAPAEHPAWCDPLLCAVRPGVGGVHRSLTRLVAPDPATTTAVRLGLWCDVADLAGLFLATDWTTSHQPIEGRYDLTTGQGRQLRHAVGWLLEQARRTGGRHRRGGTA